MLSDPFRLSHCSFDGPAMLETTPNQTRTESRDFSQFASGSYDSFIGQSPCIPSVVGLGFHAGPSAVFRSVVTVWVNAIKRESARLLAHVFKKSKKAIPSLAHLDATTSVVMVAFLPWVGASRLHGSPRSVLASFGLIMVACPILPILGSKASTTSSESIYERRAYNGLYGPAFTLTDPCDSVPEPWLIWSAA